MRTIRNSSHYPWIKLDLKTRSRLQQREAALLLPLPTFASAKLPNEIAKESPFADLTGLSMKILLYLLYEYQRRDKEGKEGWLAAGINIAVSWHRLVRHISPESVRAAEDSHYDLFRKSLEQLYRVDFRRETVTERGEEETSWRLIYGIRYDKKSRIAMIDLNQRFGLLAANFTLIPLRDAFVLDHPRQIRVLMWAAAFLNLKNPDFRTLSVQAIRNALGLEGEAYNDWRQVSKVLQKHLATINQRTSFNMQALPVKSGREVIGVRFSVTKDLRKRTGKATPLRLGL